MNNLNELIIQYKKVPINPAKNFGKNSKTKLLNDIFSLLARFIQKKSEFVFYQQIFIHKGNYLRLSDTKLIEFSDIKQELCLEILRLIEKCKLGKPFDTYLYSSLWKWKPKIINKKFFKQLDTVSDTYIDNEENSTSIIENIVVEPKEIEEPLNFIDKFENLTEDEKKIIKMIEENSSIKQSELADKLGVTRARISQIFKSLRNKYKKGLTND